MYPFQGLPGKGVPTCLNEIRPFPFSSYLSCFPSPGGFVHFPCAWCFLHAPSATVSGDDPLTCEQFFSLQYKGRPGIWNATFGKARFYSHRKLQLRFQKVKPARPYSRFDRAGSGASPVVPPAENRFHPPSAGTYKAEFSAAAFFFYAASPPFFPYYVRTLEISGLAPAP